MTGSARLFVSVIIPVLNDKERLFLCLKALAGQTYPEELFEVVVADNASTDGSIEFVQTNYPEIGIVRNDKNYGYAQGYNEALKKVYADVFVLLNSDVEVSSGWIEEATKVFSMDENIFNVIIEDNNSNKDIKNAEFSKTEKRLENIGGSINFTSETKSGNTTILNIPI